MTDNNHNRRRILKTIGTGAVASGAVSRSVIAKNPGDSSSDNIHTNSIEYDLIVTNNLSEESKVTISITTPNGSNTIKSLDLQLSPNNADLEGDGHLFKEDSMPQLNGPMIMKVEMSNGGEKSQKVYLPSNDEREFTALSVTINQKGLKVGQTQI